MYYILYIIKKDLLFTDTVKKFLLSVLTVAIDLALNFFLILCPVIIA